MGGTFPRLSLGHPAALGIIPACRGDRPVHRGGPNAVRGLSQRFIPGGRVRALRVKALVYLEDLVMTLGQFS